MGLEGVLFRSLIHGYTAGNVRTSDTVATMQNFCPKKGWLRLSGIWTQFVQLHCEKTVPFYEFTLLRRIS